MLDINVVVMLIEAAIFLITLILLNMMLFKPLLTFMEQRDAKLEAERKAASSNDDEAKRYEAEIANILANAKAEAAKIKKAASDEAKAEAAKIIQEAMSEMDKQKEAFYAELESKKGELANSLQEQAQELKDMLSSKLKGIA
ncbi:MAG: hypothetical protein GXO40_06760 [Epsilonproteobacteria bacterium]|jgi:F-type H+-transporting ATPase subunit b|nr:hypothetical protein [Campylobacterota bacterium]